MLFSSITFLLLFLPIVLLVYFLLSFSRLAQNIFLFIASLFFYAWAEPKFVVILLVSIILNTLFGYLVDKYREDTKAIKIILALTCVFNLGNLYIFKYLNFTIKNINGILSTQIPMQKIMLPLGISFFTFKALSYVIDVYRNKTEVQKNPLYVGLYIAFFPQLLSGPIARYGAMKEQILHRKFDFDRFSAGFCRFIIGLGKKVILVSCFAGIADNIFKMISFESISVSLAWLGAISYTLQIFFDFASYSDMAIGLGMMFGFDTEENFNYPYVSKSIGEFWRRWHISLATWFKDYVYFPLGGSRVSNKDIMIRNMFVVWLLTGIWHGAEWTFIFWGLFNFIWLLFERMVNFEKINIKPWIKQIYLLIIINFGWVMFRSPNLSLAIKYWKNMFGINANQLYCSTTWMFLKENMIFILIGIILCTTIAKRCNKLLEEKKFRGINSIIQMAYVPALLILFTISITYLVKGTYNPFIYFNF